MSAAAADRQAGCDAVDRVDDEMRRTAAVAATSEKTATRGAASRILP